jgi:hypothetical protein
MLLVSGAEDSGESAASRFRAKRGRLERGSGLLPESHGQNLALTVLYAPYWLDSELMCFKYEARLSRLRTSYCRVNME